MALSSATVKYLRSATLTEALSTRVMVDLGSEAWPGLGVGARDRGLPGDPGCSAEGSARFSSCVRERVMAFRWTCSTTFGIILTKLIKSAAGE